MEKQQTKLASWESHVMGMLRLRRERAPQQFSTGADIATGPKHSVTPGVMALSEHDAGNLIGQLKAFGATRWRSITQLLVTAVAFVALWLGMWLSLDHGYWITLLLALPAAGFLVRLFIIQHDCGHGSYFRSRRANDIVGRVLGVITLTPYDYWKRAHATHHAMSGNLDGRGVSDIDTLTVKEYRALTRWRRLVYRLFRHPLVLFGLGPGYLFVITHRLPLELPLLRTGLWRGVMATNVAITGLLVALAVLIGPIALTMIHLPLVLLGSATGVWMFFVQHQFEDTYWERGENWDFVQAALRGSSYYRLPGVLQWMTGHIGLHHVHHLSSKVPNYRLQECLDRIPELKCVQPITMLGSLGCARLALWDEDSRKLISFRDAVGLIPKPAPLG
jgi:omega-6 fatty acid desaturase (delta-12 desaturase)